MLNKQRFRVSNWKDYNQSLVNRGNISLWINEDITENWESNDKNKRKGRPEKYTNLAIETALTIQSLYKLPLRATEGFITGLFKMLNFNLQSPDHSTLSIRRKSLDIKLPILNKKEPIILAIDSTGLKIFGEGEWKVRQHGYTKRRTWRKLHISIDANTQEIISVLTTKSNRQDKEMLEPSLNQINLPIKKILGDAGYDSHKNYSLSESIDSEPVIPPRKDARISRHNLPRDKIVRRIKEIGLKNWKIESGYHKRSIVETTMFRLKIILGDKLSSRLLISQILESTLRCKILNKMTNLGMPISYRV